MKDLNQRRPGDNRGESIDFKKDGMRVQRKR